MVEDNPDFTITPCASCNETSTVDELMVSCDCCKRWFHARCVNFNPADKKPGKKWYCSDRDYQKKKRTKKPVDEPLPISPEVQEKLKAMEARGGGTGGESNPEGERDGDGRLPSRTADEGR